MATDNPNSTKATQALMRSYWLILNDPEQWSKAQFGHGTSKLSSNEKREFENFLNLAKINYKN